MNSLETMNDDFFHVVEYIDYPLGFRYVAAFEQLDDAKDYTEYLATINRKSWVYGHEEPPTNALEGLAWLDD
jgi:hypothetical protein